MTKFEHTTVVLNFEKRTFAMTSRGVCQGLSEESAKELVKMGEEGWELVSVLPYTTGGTLVLGPVNPN